MFSLVLLLCLFGCEGEKEKSFVKIWSENVYQFFVAFGSPLSFFIIFKPKICAVSFETTMRDERKRKVLGAFWQFCIIQQ